MTFTLLRTHQLAFTEASLMLPPPRNEIGCRAGVAVAELDPIARAGVVGRPGLIAVAFPANRDSR